MKQINKIQDQHNPSFNGWCDDTVIGQSFEGRSYPDFEELSKEYDGI